MRGCPSTCARFSRKGLILSSERPRLDIVAPMGVGGRGTSLLVWAVAFSPLGCGGSSYVPRAHAPAASDDQSRCREAALRESPLVTEWSAAEKANLEARLREGAVAVEYTGCEMRPVTGCQIRGSYRWQQTTLSSDTIDIRSEDELFAKLPLGALNLEGELERSGHLRVRTTVAGQYVLEGSSVDDVPDYGDCAAATHILGGLSVGAFQMSSGEEIAGGARAEVAERGGGFATKSSESVLRESGEPNSCKEATSEMPNMQCSSPVQAFLRPLPRFAKRRGQGTVEATFVAGAPDVAWELRADQKFVCRTPCSRWMTPGEPYELRLENGVELRTLPVPDLRPYVGAADLQVVAYDKKEGAFITGLAMTGVGGGVMFMGGFLALMGGLAERQGLAVAGAVTAGVGLVQLGPGIYLTATSGAKTEVYSGSQQLASGEREMGIEVQF